MGGKKIWQLGFPGTSSLGKSGSLCSIPAVHTPGEPPCSTCLACGNVNAGIFPCSVQDLKANESRLKDINKVAKDLESEGLMADEVQAVQQQVLFFSVLMQFKKQKIFFLSFVCFLCLALQDSGCSLVWPSQEDL